MKRKHVASITVALVAFLGTALIARAADTVLQGQDAFGDFKRDAPGVWHKITVGDLPKPFASESSRNFPQLVARTITRCRRSRRASRFRFSRRASSSRAR